MMDEKEEKKKFWQCKKFTRRFIVVKGVVTASLIVQLTHPELAAAATVGGGLIWLWLDS